MEAMLKAIQLSHQMSEEQLKAFWEAIQADTALQQKLQGVTDPDAIVAIAKEAGFTISADELKKAMESVAELSDELLRGATGGDLKDGCWSTGDGPCASAPSIAAGFS